ncbi:hypothetical protein D3C87_1733350 [compost metagenome]
MNIDDQRTLTREPGRVRLIEEAGHRLTVKALHLDQGRLDIDRGVQAAGLAVRPLGYGQGLGIDREGVARHTRRRQAEAYGAPGRDVDGGADAVRNDAVGQAVH